MEHQATIILEANSAELLTALVDAFDSNATTQAIHAWLEDHPAKPLDEGSEWSWHQHKPEPEVYLGCGFRFFGASLEELEAAASQRRFEKPASDWQMNTLWEVLDAMDDVVLVEEEKSIPEFDHYRLGNVHIEVV